MGCRVAVVDPQPYKCFQGDVSSNLREATRQVMSRNVPVYAQAHVAVVALIWGVAPSLHNKNTFPHPTSHIPLLKVALS